MKSTDAVYQWMTPLPFSVHRGDSVAKAHALFTQHGIRHLPVIDDDMLVGLISERDVQVAELFAGTRELSIESVMAPDPWVTAPFTPLAEVAAEMTKRREDAVVVVDAGRVVGLFTSVDALRAIAGTRDLSAARSTA